MKTGKRILSSCNLFSFWPAHVAKDILVAFDSNKIVNYFKTVGDIASLTSRTEVVLKPLQLILFSFGRSPYNQSL